MLYNLQAAENADTVVSFLQREDPANGWESAGVPDLAMSADPDGELYASFAQVLGGDDYLRFRQYTSFIGSQSRLILEDINQHMSLVPVRYT